MGCETEITNATQFVHDTNKHGNGIHQELLVSLPQATLQQIGWYKCSPHCTTLSFTDGHASKHQTQCQLYNDHQRSLAPIPITTQDPIPQQQELSQHTLFESCPPQFHNDLQTLLDNNTDQGTIYTTVLRWNAIANSANTHK